MDTILVAFPASEQTDTKFLFYLLTDAKLSRYAGGAAQPLVTQTVLKQVEVLVPPLPIQRRIKILESMARAIYREWFVHFRFPGTAAAAGSADKYQRVVLPASKRLSARTVTVPWPGKL